MSTDVVVFRTERIVPHVGIPAGRPRLATTSTDQDSDEVDVIEEIDRTPGPFDRLAERFVAGRARWAQLTFYLLDPESWR